ncbi:uncharacterized protein EDB93DRAFT_1252006 [Suillus bovinus]|uniref:uncharacterized protein n=1 Tax=Suillus bovinus TaxID=48563 RepID=UPI001B87D79D|nr:uncharacterized protein EDB93DRAFT_1252006 [Suillus bovinus]KAG2143403.1 hypothetical protein EDB93DRAFT_1252006 [Suillus bovinus]
MPPERKQVVVLYAETKLQKSIDLPGSLTVARAKEEGMVAIRDHLNALPGVPSVSLDLYRFLPRTIIPSYAVLKRLTPSPFVDALQSAIQEVRDVKAQKNATLSIREENAQCNVKPGVFCGLQIHHRQTNVFSAANDILSVLLRRFQAMEEKIVQDIAELRRENAELKHDVEELAGLKSNIEELRRENAGLKNDIKELRDQTDESARATLGDKVAIDRIRRQGTP